MNKKTDYAIRAAVYLARHYSDERSVTASEIAEGGSIPRRYLAHILLAMKKKALVSSLAGPNGGYRLMRRPEMISIAEIVEAVSGLNEPGSAGLCEENNIYCTASQITEAKKFKAVSEILSSLSLSALTSEAIEKSHGAH